MERSGDFLPKDLVARHTQGRTLSKLDQMIHQKQIELLMNFGKSHLARRNVHTIFFKIVASKLQIQNEPTNFVKNLVIIIKFPAQIFWVQFCDSCLATQTSI